MSSSTPALGALVWISCKPLIRLAISTGLGYTLAKKDLLGPIAARGVGQIILNVTLPSLLFSKLVPAFTSQNIVALGPLVFIALVYQALGFVAAWLIRLVFYVPRKFQNGILVAGAWNNWGDVPVAVLMSITSAAPFNPNTDEALAVAYIAPFILVYFVTLFPLGGTRILMRDFKDSSVEDEGDLGWRSRFQALGRSVKRGTRVVRRSSISVPAPVMDKDEELEAQECSPEDEEKIVDGCSRHVTFLPDESTAAPTRQGPLSPTATAINGQEVHHSKKPSPPIVLGTGLGRTRPTRQPYRALSHLVPFLRSLLEPICVVMIISIIIALVPSLKALFTPVTDSSVNIPNAPDGLPPLSVILDIATFFGNASVPMGLICLGSAFARMNLPRPISRAPLGAIISMAVVKMVVIPVIGILIVQALTYHTGMLDPNDKVLRFVAIFLSAVPTATTQVYLTQVYSPDGNAEHLPAFLIPQYILMFFSMTIITGFCLHMLF